MLLACGVDPNRSAFFCESSARHHADLLWALSCITPVAWLSDSKQKKKKSTNDTLGTFSYRVQRTASVLMYNPQHMVIGDGQGDFIKFVGDMAEGLNAICRTNAFVRPAVYRAPYFGVYNVMDMQKTGVMMDPRSPNKRSVIYLNDSEKDVKEKVVRAVSDSVGKVRSQRITAA